MVSVFVQLGKTPMQIKKMHDDANNVWVKQLLVCYTLWFGHQTSGKKMDHRDVEISNGFMYVY